MQKYIFIATGGIIGSLLRYYIKNMYIQNYHQKFPFTTMFVNITGSFLLAFLLSLFLGSVKIDPKLQLALTVGFLGSYTTFSTFCKDTMNLITDKRYGLAVLNLSVSTILGFMAVYFGVFVANKFITSILARNKKTYPIKIIEKGGLE
jgi:fluoride exporter